MAAMSSVRSGRSASANALPTSESWRIQRHERSRPVQVARVPSTMSQHACGGSKPVRAGTNGSLGFAGGGLTSSSACLLFLW